MNKSLIWILGILLLSSFASAQVYLQIDMTGYTTPSPYACSQSSAAAGTCWLTQNVTRQNADLNCAGTGACAWQCNTLPCTMYMDLGISNSTPIVQYRINSYNSVSYIPTTWTFEGSNDNITYFVLDSKTGTYFSGGNQSNFTTNSNATTAYRYFKLLVTTTSGLGRSMIENLDFYKENPVINNIILSAGLPLDNAYFNTNPILFNATLDNIYTTNCSLYTNVTGTFQLNETKYYGGGVGNLVNFSKNFPDGYFQYKINCTQGNDTKHNQTTLVKNFLVDATLPTITTNLTNNIFIPMNLNNTFQFNFSDNIMLWGYNFTLNGVLNNYSQNIQTTFAQKDYTNDTYKIGKNNLSVVVMDAHTAESIDNFRVSETSESIKFDELEIKSLTPINDIGYIKSKDRYSFVFETKEPTKTLQIKVPDGCVYQNREDLYVGWFVCPGLKWMDFESDNGYKFSLDKDIITLTSEKDINLFLFNSVGALNVVTQNYTLWGFNTTTQAETSIMEDTTSTYSLTLSGTNLSFTSLAYLIYNGVPYLTTSSTGAGYINYSVSITTAHLTTDTNIPYYFNYLVNGVNYSTTPTNQSTIAFNLTTCGTGTNTLNISLYDELNSTALNGTIIYSLTYWRNDQTYNKTISGTWGTPQNFMFCIYPNSTTINTSASIYYSSTNYPQRRYQNLLYLSNTTTQLSLFLLEASKGIYARFKIIDAAQSTPIVNADGTEVLTSSGVTIEKSTSDGAGLITFWANPDTDYTYTFSKTGYTSVTTTLRPSGTDTYTITLSSSTTQNQSKYTGLQYSYSPTNTTLSPNTNYTFIFNLSSSYWGISGCTLNIKLINGTTLSTISGFNTSSCVLGISYNTNNYTTISSQLITIVNGTTITYDQWYSINQYSDANFTFQDALDDINNFTDAGFGGFTKAILALILIVVLLIAANQIDLQLGIAGETKMEKGMILACVLVYFFSYIGWLTISYPGLPGVAGLPQYLIAYFATFLTIGFIAWRNN